MLAPKLIIPFDGNHASIPAGFTRKTALDDKYPKGAPNATNPGSTGGASTHSHTSPSHTHTFNGHTHSITTDTARHELISSQQSDSGGSSIGRSTHSHSGTSSSLINQSVSSEAVTYSAVSNDPPFYKVIFIESQGYNFIPNNAMVLSAATSRAGLDFHTASANKYLKGASTGANAGGTGGSLTNTHTIAHDHSTTHGHSGTTGNNSGGIIDRQSGANSPLSMATHQHPFTLNDSTADSDSNSSIGSQSETVEPAYKTLNAYKNTSGNNVLPKPGDIGLWMEPLADIPVGWSLCNGSNGTTDMREKFLKIPTSAASPSTGGSNTHTHAAQGHTHNIASHTHGGSVGAAPETVARKASGDQGDCWGGANSFHPQHTLSSVSSTTDGLASANTTANSSDNQPEYVEVAYIQMLFQVGGGASVIPQFM